MYIKTKFGEFEWDDAKADYNFREHGVRFTDAVYIFADHRILTEPVRGQSYEEIRKLSFGTLKGVLVVAVVHTKRQKAKRIISARPASRKERKRFAAFIKSGY